MGDRANIKTTSSEGSINFYSHWYGTGLPVILRDALIRGKSRWSDHAYLNRIIFCEMVQNDVMEETGFGISFQPCDGQDRIVEVNTDNQTVLLNGVIYTFAEYIAHPVDLLLWGS